MAVRKLGLSLIMVGGVLLAATLLFGLRLGNIPPQMQEGPSLPDQIAGYSLIRKSTGEQAIAELNNMHGRDFPFQSGAVGGYGAGQQATLWVSGLERESDAAEMVSAMRERIALGNSPFKPLDVWQDGDRMVFELVGMGQKHYYFRSELLVVWLAVDANLADEALAEVLIYYR